MIGYKVLLNKQYVMAKEKRQKIDGGQMNIYVREQTFDQLDYLSEVLDEPNRSAVVRWAIKYYAAYIEKEEALKN